MDCVTRIHDGNLARITADEADAEIAFLLRDVAADVSWRFGVSGVTAHIEWCRKPLVTYTADWKEH